MMGSCLNSRKIRRSGGPVGLLAFALALAGPSALARESVRASGAVDLLKSCPITAQAAKLVESSRVQGNLALAREWEKLSPKISLSKSQTGLSRGGYVQDVTLGARITIPNPLQLHYSIRSAGFKADEVLALGKAQALEGVSTQAGRFAQWRYLTLLQKQAELAEGLIKPRTRDFDAKKASQSEIRDYLDQLEVLSIRQYAEEGLSVLSFDPTGCGGGSTSGDTGKSRWLRPIQFSKSDFATLSANKDQLFNLYESACESRLKSERAAIRSIQARWIPDFYSRYGRVLKGNTVSSPNEWSAGIEWSIPIGGITASAPEVSACEFQLLKDRMAESSQKKSLERSVEQVSVMYDVRVRTEKFLDSVRAEVARGAVERRELARLLIQYQTVLRALAQEEQVILSALVAGGIK